MKRVPPADFTELETEHFKVAANFDRAFTRQEFLHAYAGRFPSRPEGSMIPSDYCVNMDNKGNPSHPRFLEQIGRGRYRFVRFQHRGPAKR